MRTLPRTRTGTIESRRIHDLFAQVRVCGFEMLIESIQVVVEEMDVAARCDGGTLEGRDAVAFEGSTGAAPVHGGDRWGCVSDFFLLFCFSFFFSSLSFGEIRRKGERMLAAT